MSELVLCPACNESKAPEYFKGAPFDLRCDACIPVETAMALHDKRVQEAGATVARIFDANEHGLTLKPLERMVSLAYDSWGGANAFMEDVVQWIKDMGDNPRTKGTALTNAMKLLNLHAKVDRMKLEDDWKQMDDDTLRANLKMKLFALIAEAQTDEGKKGAVKKILGEE